MRCSSSVIGSGVGAESSPIRRPAPQGERPPIHEDQQVRAATDADETFGADDRSRCRDTADHEVEPRNVLKQIQMHMTSRSSVLDHNHETL